MTIATWYTDFFGFFFKIVFTIIRLTLISTFTLIYQGQYNIPQFWVSSIYWPWDHSHEVFYCLIIFTSFILTGIGIFKEVELLPQLSSNPPEGNFNVILINEDQCMVNHG